MPWTVALAIAALMPLVVFLLPESPGSIGIGRYGAAAEPPTRPSAGNPFSVALHGLASGARSVDFWLLVASFSVCGFSTNGLVGTHLIAFCVDHGIAEVTAAGLLAVMGVFDLIGTTASGWLTDRFNPRVLLFWYYGLRGLSLAVLPFTDFDPFSLSVFAVFYGLDWVATVPPTVALTNEVFGRQDAPVMVAWIFAAHQVGGALAAFGAGAVRNATGSYMAAFLASGMPACWRRCWCCGSRAVRCWRWQSDTNVPLSDRVAPDRGSMTVAARQVSLTPSYTKRTQNFTK